MFLSDYDMLLTAHLVQGVDVWINTPQRPWEACGTSGMKVLVNGGINLSELDGWWAEAYAADLGWSIGDGKEHGNDAGLDRSEAEKLYDLLEHEVVPQFYNRDEHGIPVAWVSRMRESMAQLTPRFSASRTVREYTELHYIPAATNYRSRVNEKGKTGRQIIEWRRKLEDNWSKIRLGELKVEKVGEHHQFQIEVFLNDLDPHAVQVELYANGVQGNAAVREEMALAPRSVAGLGSFAYSATLSSPCSSADFTVRIIPRFEDVSVPLEETRILWQR
jgi:starch phosphorylase